MDLLCTVPSLSPVSLISAIFGNDEATSLCEVNSADSIHQLSGYLSKPKVGASSKGFQYLYINSRYICKGPIQKLIDSLSTDYQCLRNLWREEPEFQKRKRNKIHCYTSYLLNLVCPFTLYDLIFEPSKTVAQFKDWTPVLSFIKQAVKSIWEQDSILDSLGHAELQEYDTDSKLNQCKAICSNQIECSSQIFNHDTKDNACSQFDQMVTSSFPIRSKFLSEDMLYGGGCPVTGEVDYLNFESRAPRHCQGDRSLQYLSGNLIDYDVCDRECIDTKKFTTCGNELEKPEFECGSSVLALGTSDIFSKLKGYEFKSGDTTDVSMPESYNSKSWSFTPDNHQMKVLGFSGSFMMKKCQLKSKSQFLDKDYILPYNKNLQYPEDNEIGSLTPAQNCRNDIFHQLQDSEGHLKHAWSPTTCIRNRSDDLEKKYGSYTRSTTHRDVFPDPFCLDEMDGTVDYGNTRNLLDNASYTRGTSHWDVPPDLFGLGEVNGTLNFGNNRNLLGSAEETSTKRHFDEFETSETTRDVNCLQSQSLVKANHDGTNWLESRSSVKITYDNKFTDDHLLLRCQRCRPFKTKHRSHSAPPFHKGKSKFAPLNDCRISTFWRNSHTWLPCNRNLQGTADVSEEISHSGDISESLNEQIVGACSDFYARDNHDNGIKQGHNLDLCCTSNTDDECFEKDKDVFGSTFMKWRSSSPEITIREKSFKVSNEKHDILSISSGLLNLAGNFVGSESISRDSLERAKVLLQLDKKFIPIVADGTLSIIDQHAADERVRLEELRRKVLSGEGITVSYLESQQDLVLPEVGLQLMQIYAERIKKWGWVCNLQDCAESFSKNLTILKRRPSNITLLAVPCILGVNLSDRDLIEYLEQLSETDGSATVPPSVTRLLSSKACRGAIMFGDSLLPSECSLLVDELKKTSLCFQCAHGRPTTVPIINMAELHRQLAKLERHHGGGRSEEWYGLRQHVPSFQRAQSRLNSSKRRLGHA